MRQPLALILSCALIPSLAWSAEPKAPTTLLSKPGKSLYQDDLSQLPKKGDWRYGPGEWTIADGSLKGVELEKDKHGAVLRRMLPFKNAIIAYEFQFHGARASSFSVNDAKEHVCRVQLGPRLFKMQKDDHDHAGPDVAEVFASTQIAIAPQVWHSLVVEILGTEMVATLDDKHTSYGSHALIATDKANFGFTVTGDAMRFRNLGVWEAEPNADWEKIKHKYVKPSAKPSADAK